MFHVLYISFNSDILQLPLSLFLSLRFIRQVFFELLKYLHAPLFQKRFIPYVSKLRELHAQKADPPFQCLIFQGSIQIRQYLMHLDVASLPSKFKFEPLNKYLFRVD